MQCLVAEKPSVARDIARVLGTPETHEGYLTIGQDWVITWAFGHLVTLADPEQYQAEWKAWRWDTLPMIPATFQLVPIAKSQAQWQIVQRWLNDPHINRVICATDPDREGQHIWENIWALSGAHKPVDRLWLVETTPRSIQAAFQHLKPNQTYQALAEAAKARAHADWLVGLNATRAFTLRHGVPGQGALSVGRVQTPTLALIVQRDHTIAHFQPTPYWQVDVTFQAPVGTYIARWTGPDRDTPDRLPSVEAAEAIVRAVPPHTPGCITRIDRKQVTIHPPLPFSLNELQKLCNRRLGMTAQQTLDSAQRLYEQHWTSYPRTDTPYLTQAIADTLPQRLRGLPTTYAEWVRQVPRPLATARLVNEAKVAAAGHHAIIPTGETGTSLNTTDAAVYDLIVRRLLAALLPAGQDERTTITTTAAQHTFLTKGTAIVTLGWRTVLEPSPPSDPADGSEAEPETPVIIPAGLQPEMAVHVLSAQTLAKHTKPPAPLNDASVLTLMEKHGLGTPATRARIVEILLLRQYVERRKKTLLSTPKGQALIEVVPEALRSPELTGEWEHTLEAIAEGTDTYDPFITRIKAYTQEIVTLAHTQPVSPKAITDSPWGLCPVCHQGAIIATAKAWSCSRWRDGCSFTIWKTIAGKPLTPTQVKTLLAGKPTAVLQGFRSKAGKPFAAQLQLVDGRVTMLFPSNAKTPPAKRSSQP